MALKRVPRSDLFVVIALLRWHFPGTSLSAAKSLKKSKNPVVFVSRYVHQSDFSVGKTLAPQPLIPRRYCFFVSLGIARFLRIFPWVHEIDVIWRKCEICEGFWILEFMNCEPRSDCGKRIFWFISFLPLLFGEPGGLCSLFASDPRFSNGVTLPTLHLYLHHDFEANELPQLL